MTIDAVGHLGYVFLGLGILQLTRKRRSGFALRLVGEGIWTGIGFALGMTSIWAWGAVFCVMDCYGWGKWGKQNERN